MAINFPATPTLNQTYTYNGRTWTYNNVGWQATGSTGLTVYTKTNFTATAAQTSFSVTYTVGFVDVYYNGSKLSSSEYTATTGSTVVLGTACALNDIVETIAWTISSSFNPSLGSASATSLAIGGATIGSNALAVTGTTQLNSALNYGGVTLSNAVTGTGNMVLSASPTLTGTLTAAIANFSGAVSGTAGFGNGTAGQISNNISQNSLTSFQVTNSNAGVAAQASYRLYNGTTIADLSVFGTAFTTDGVKVANGVALDARPGGAADLALLGTTIRFATSGTTEIARFNIYGLGIGVTPAAWGSGNSALQVGTTGSIDWYSANSQIAFSNNWYLNSAGNSTYLTTAAASNYTQVGGLHIFNYAASGTAGNTFSFSEAMRIDASGNLLVGTTTNPSGSNNVVVAGTLYVKTGMNLASGSVAQFTNAIAFYGVTSSDWQAANAAGSAMRIGVTSGRSVNAGGTYNANGADYAEYMTKADNCAIIPKGAVCGINVNGKLTDKFSDAHSFVIKSTNPSYVGGDNWDDDVEEGDATALEAARQTVDRIAFSGQVPVNVTGATVGDYIVPVAGSDGSIAGEAVTNPTFDQYRAAVGRVWKILEDGRAFVSVKVS